MDPKKKPEPTAPTRAARKPRPSKATWLQIRVDDAQKELIFTAAEQVDETMSDWARRRLLKLAKGWRLVPPYE